MMLFWASAIQKVVWEPPQPEALASPGSLKLQLLGPHLTPTEAKLTSEQELQKVPMPSVFQSWVRVT